MNRKRYKNGCTRGERLEPSCPSKRWLSQIGSSWQDSKSRWSRQLATRNVAELIDGGLFPQTKRSLSLQKVSWVLCKEGDTEWSSSCQHGKETLVRSGNRIRKDLKRGTTAGRSPLRFGSGQHPKKRDDEAAAQRQG